MTQTPLPSGEIIFQTPQGNKKAFVHHALPEGLSLQFNTIVREYFEKHPDINPYTHNDQVRQHFGSILREMLPWNVVQDLEAHTLTGYPNVVLLSGVPIDEARPATPESAFHPTLKGGVSEAASLGLLFTMGLKVQHNMIERVTPAPGKNTIASGQSSGIFPLHMEMPHIPFPPRELTLLTEQQGSAKTPVIFVDLIVARLQREQPELFAIMQEPLFVMKSLNGEIKTEPMPILNWHPKQGWFIRGNFAGKDTPENRRMEITDSSKQPFLEAIYAFMEKEYENAFYAILRTNENTGMFAAIGNYKTLHARAPFGEGYPLTNPIGFDAPAKIVLPINLPAGGFRQHNYPDERINSSNLGERLWAERATKEMNLVILQMREKKLLYEPNVDRWNEQATRVIQKPSIQMMIEDPNWLKRCLLRTYSVPDPQHRFTTVQQSQQR
ncbi:MAG: TauD/TfdA family dioxygenase [Hyphomicrobiales bacterium]|nr:TauD/TfdA family dioxygenase [Hyphomicrobiales bacterium]